MSNISLKTIFVFMLIFSLGVVVGYIGVYYMYDRLLLDANKAVQKDLNHCYEVLENCLDAMSGLSQREQFCYDMARQFNDFLKDISEYGRKQGNERGKKHKERGKEDNGK